MRSCVLVPLALAFGLALAPVVAQAATVFDFYWSGVDVDDPAHAFTASGTMTIEKDAGEAFDFTDISSVAITLDGGVLGSFVIDDWTSGAGTIDGSGAFATWDPTSEPYFYSNFSGTTALADGYYFGCDIADCTSNGSAGVASPIAIIFDAGAVHRVAYDSPSDAAASMTLTFAAVPLPPTLPLAALGLAALGWISRRRAA
ncbi:hypothetical protein [uncultured Albimonas sp.]|uniref:hypothetical protein n=1 Tax=uncultured Albimonas sp. TaxID=1331701 RepID=UPI0030EEB392|tara:strand:+ start:411 stop:1013 length:603 start_codon:yes stop_codon:yes gene_type:complete